MQHVSAHKIVFYSGSEELASIEVKSKGFAEVEVYDFIDNWASYIRNRIFECTAHAVMRCDND